MNSEHAFQVGEFNCTLFNDYQFQYGITDYFQNVAREEVINGLSKYGILQDPIPSPYVALLIESQNEKVLIDTGLGIRDEPLKFKEHEFAFDGKLISMLIQKNLLNKIDKVILTHLHPDHAGGLFNELGKVHFPNAEIIVHQDEWIYWTKKYSMGSSPVFDYTVREQVIPIMNHKLHLIAQDEYEISSGINLIKVPGHTPGQMAVHITSKGENLLYISDAWLHPLHIEHLDWKTAFDIDHSQAKQSKIKLLDLAYSKNMLIQSFHFDFPGLGRVDKINDQWKWIEYNQ